MTSTEAPATEHNLGDILRRILVVHSDEVAAALEARGEGQRLGEALVAAGAITEAELRIALEIQEGLRSDSATARVEAAQRMADVASANAARP